MSETANVRYVFLDIVGFTRKRTVEAQSDLVAALNRIVTAAIASTIESDTETILIPTGDGIAVAILDCRSWDVHIRLALEILRAVADHNVTTTDEMRKFEVRIGVNENVDNVVLDINNRRNVAGYGISMAQRVMDKADAGQLLVGGPTHEIVSPREKYNKAFRVYHAAAKHGTRFSLYQLAINSPGLNVQVPSAFAEDKPKPVRLTTFVAYYIAYAATHRAFLLSRNADPVRDKTAVVLLSLLAQDSFDETQRPVHERAFPRAWNAGKASFNEQYEYYRNTDFWVLARAAELLTRTLEPYEELFDGEEYFRNFAFLGDTAVQKLREQYPSIASEFKLNAE